MQKWSAGRTPGKHPPLITPYLPKPLESKGCHLANFQTKPGEKKTVKKNPPGCMAYCDQHFIKVP